MMTVDDFSDDGTEGSPLLDPEIDDEAPPLVSRRGLWYQPSTPAGVVGLITFILFCMTLSGTMSLIPFGRLIEDVVCRKFYGSLEPIEEQRCKVDEVQTELAWLGGGYVFINSIVGLIVAFPWSVLSDRIGRKPVFRLSFFSLILGGSWSTIVLVRWDIFPIYLMLLSPLSAVFGGGLSVTIAVIHSIIADVTTERSSGFISLSLGAVAGAIAGPAIAAKMMQVWQLWVPLTISGFFLIPIIFISTIFLPETRPHLTNAQVSSRPDEPFLSTLLSHLAHARERLGESLTMLHKRSVILLLATFFISEPVQQVYGQTLAQLISKRFHWTLAETGYMFSARGTLVVVVLAILPVLSGVLTGRYQFSVFRKDLVLAQVSLVCLVIGSLLTGGEHPAEVVTGLVISTFSAGISSLAKGLIASYVDTEHMARLFALTGMVETAGAIFGGPSVAWAFDRGVKMGGRWMGLPFFYIAVLSAIALAALFFVERHQIVKHDEESLNRGSVEL